MPFPPMQLSLSSGASQIARALVIGQSIFTITLALLRQELLAPLRLKQQEGAISCLMHFLGTPASFLILETLMQEIPENV